MPSHVAIPDDALAEIFGEGAPFTGNFELTNGDENTATVVAMLLEAPVEGEDLSVNKLQLQIRTSDVPSWFVEGKNRRVIDGETTYSVGESYINKTGISRFFLGEE